MNLKVIFLFVPWLFLCCLLAGCGPRVVTGQVFIVGQGGDNTKLGLVEVALIEQKEVEKFLTTKQKAIAERTAVLNEAVAKIKAKLEKTEKDHVRFFVDNPEYSALKEKVNRIKSEDIELFSKISADENVYKAYSGDTEYSRQQRAELLQEMVALEQKRPKIKAALEPLQEQIRPLQQKEETLLTDIETSRLEFDRAVADLNRFPSLHFCFSDFAPIIFAKATTDADGKFSMACPKHVKFAVFAKRADYLWLFWLPNDTASQPLLLSNNNLASSDFALNIVGVKRGDSLRQ